MDIKEIFMITRRNGHGSPQIWSTHKVARSTRPNYVSWSYRAVTFYFASSKRMLRQKQILAKLITGHSLYMEHGNKLIQCCGPSYFAQGGKIFLSYNNIFSDIPIALLLQIWFLWEISIKTIPKWRLPRIRNEKISLISDKKLVFVLQCLYHGNSDTIF